MELPIVVQVRVPVLPYRGLSYRAGRRLLMPVSDARRLSGRGAVELLEDIDDADDAPQDTEVRP